MAKRDNDMKSKVDRIVEKFLGFNEPVLAATALNCVNNGYDKKKTTEKLGNLLDTSKAEKLAEKLSGLYTEGVKDTKTNRKRHFDDLDPFTENKKIKSDRDADKKGDVLSSNEIKNMMANAQKMIEERKKSLMAIKGGSNTNSQPPVKSAPKALPTPPISSTVSAVRVPDEKAKKIALLQAQIKNKLSSGVLGFDGSGIQVGKPTPLILDSEGRTVDSTGREVQLTHVVPTLKANIRAKKREEFKAQLQEKPTEESSEAKFFDPRISARSNVRNRKALRFHEPGKFQQMADRMRMKAQLQKLQSEISQIAKKTGITSATKLAQIAPKVEQTSADIPHVEWWDSVVLLNDSYGPDDEEPKLKEEAITHLIEHPIQMKAPTVPSKPVYMPVFLTKKERKKLRRQNRRETWKEEQEKIRLGLVAPPEPKVLKGFLLLVCETLGMEGDI
ncbi:unnamed protein product [Nezara viridula]|uniref:Pre-mRNA-splicing factor 3 domain-containing protein n=1 Tax=Nezara viridula TaxID=85310 RepID=A0A9P0MIJ5_NEZVI|nr:unnamed protein product [Nezara viridula]